MSSQSGAVLDRELVTPATTPGGNDTPRVATSTMPYGRFVPKNGIPANYLKNHQSFFEYATGHDMPFDAETAVHLLPVDPLSSKLDAYPKLTVHYDQVHGVARILSINGIETTEDTLTFLLAAAEAIADRLGVKYSDNPTLTLIDAPEAKITIPKGTSLSAIVIHTEPRRKAEVPQNLRLAAEFRRCDHDDSIARITVELPLKPYGTDSR